MAFDKNFMWGVASAAFQIEGAYNEDGKVLSIWDDLAKGKIVNGENGNVACDHYHRYKEDVAIMKKMGVKAYRFSISWCRIISDINTVNPEGIKFYSNLIDELLKNGIEPVVTLYHWDLPMWAYLKGGWLNPDIVNWFKDYTKVVVENFSDRVKYWMTLNEPQCFVGLGYVQGTQAPFYKVNKNDLERITINVMYTHGEAVKTIRKFAKQKPIVGYAPTSSIVIPETESKEDIEFARQESFNVFRNSYWSTAWWSDAIVLGKIPKGMEFLQKADMNRICQPLDFYAFNVYQSANVGDPDLDWFRKVGSPKTSLNWEFTPDAIYWSARFLYERYNLPVIVSENGMANNDFVMSDGKVHDPQRVEFINMYLKSLKRATDENIPVMGYFYWSLMDNLEWFLGYNPRFGLVHVDYETLERTMKDSAYRYKQIIETNGVDL